MVEAERRVERGIAVPRAFGVEHDGPFGPSRMFFGLTSPCTRAVASSPCARKARAAARRDRVPDGRREQIRLEADRVEDRVGCERRPQSSASPALAACSRAMIDADCGRDRSVRDAVEQQALPDRVARRHRDSSSRKCLAQRRSRAASARCRDNASRAKLIHAHSYALRSTGACHSFATLSCGSAHLMQIERPGRSTRQMSDDTPPVSGVHVAASPAAQALPARGMRAAADQASARRVIGQAARAPAMPAYGARACSSMRSSWLYFATVLDVRSEPILIWPAAVPTARSAMNASSVSPDRAETIVA